MGGSGTRRVVFSLALQQNCRVSCPAACALQRLGRLREHRGLEVQQRSVAVFRLQRLTQRLIGKVLEPQRVALVPSDRDEVRGQVMLRDVDLGKARDLHVPEVAQGLQARERNRNEHVEQESHIQVL